MTTPNSLLTDRLALLARIAPQSNAATVTSAYISPATLAQFGRLLVVAQTGANGTGTLTATLLNASDSSGAAAAALLTATALAGSAAANQDILFNFSTDDLDPDNPYLAVQLTVSADTCLVSALILGADARFEPASDNNAATVAQIV